MAQQILALIELTPASEAFRGMILQYLRTPAKVLEGHDGFRWGLLPLFAAQACGGSWEQSVPLGAAVEFFIAAGDVLDDLADLDTAEAVSPTGRPQLTNVAAALLMLTEQAIFLLEDRGLDPARVVSISRCFADAGIAAASGQFLDLQYEHASDVSIDACLEMTILKSGSLTRVACQAGAMSATEHISLIETCAEFGANFGAAQQLLNDIQGIWAESADKSDIRRRKKTLPVVYGLQWADGEDGQLLTRLYHSPEDLTEEQISSIRDTLRRRGSLYYSLARVDICRQRARAALQRLAPCQGRDALWNLVRSPEAQ